MSRSLWSTKHSMRFLFSVTLLVAVCTSVLAQETKVEKRPLLDLTGNQVFTKPELLAIVNTQLDEWGEDGGRYEPEMLDYCLHQMEAFMRSRGYLQARVTKGDIEQTETGPRVVLAVTEGTLYRVGKMRVDGTRLLTSEQALEAIGLRTGDIANGKKLGDALYRRLKARYAKFGFIEYEAEVTPTFNAETGAAKGVVDFAITIHEGDRFTVRSIKIDGADKTVREALTRELMLRAGDIFDAELFDESITRMNRTGLIPAIDSDRDVDFSQNQRRMGEQAVLDLIIRVKKGGAVAASQR